MSTLESRPYQDVLESANTIISNLDPEETIVLYLEPGFRERKLESEKVSDLFLDDIWPEEATLADEINYNHNPDLGGMILQGETEDGRVYQLRADVDNRAYQEALGDSGLK